VTLEWQDQALCAQVGPAPFFIEKGESSMPGRSVCAACPVRRECLTDALGHMAECGPGRYGLWGGTSPEQREYLMRRFRSNVAAAVSFAMRQDCTVTSLDMQSRKAAA
jgi:WhiB family transcriptional regulator, redox-sensing transcriptional regulator